MASDNPEAKACTVKPASPASFGADYWRHAYNKAYGEMQRLEARTKHWEWQARTLRDETNALVEKVTRLEAENSDLREELAALNMRLTVSDASTCTHCGQPDCLPHVEGCPATNEGAKRRLVEYMYDRDAYIERTRDGSLVGWDRKHVHANRSLFSIEGLPVPCTCDAEPGMWHAEDCRRHMPFVDEHGCTITPGIPAKVTSQIDAPVFAIEDDEPDDPAAPGYCPACGGSGGHRIGCPSK